MNKMKNIAKAMVAVCLTLNVASAIAEQPNGTSIKQNGSQLLALGQDATPTASESIFTTAQEKRIVEIENNYLLSHPEMLVKVSQRLREKQQQEQIEEMATAVLSHQNEILNDNSSPSYGPSTADVALIEFFDYQCRVCTRQASVLESVMSANPKVRYVFKEWPIFGQRWEPSLIAAQTGLQIWQQQGAEAYLHYHNAIYATGNNEGKLTLEDIKHAQQFPGNLKGDADSIQEVLSRTDELAQELGLRGTPGMIVMPVKGATVDNITVIPGGTDQATLQAAIDKAAGHPAAE